MRAETMGMTYAVEYGTHIRAVLAEIKEEINLQRWEAQSSKVRRHLWLTDCNSLHTYLTRAAASGSEDKRLEIDLESLREHLWTYSDGSPKDHLYLEQTDQVKWIDTSVMLCDPLTKSFPNREKQKNFCARLVRSYTTGTFDMEATPESTMRKLKAQKARKESKQKAQILLDNTEDGLEGIDAGIPEAGEDPLAEGE